MTNEDDDNGDCMERLLDAIFVAAQAEIEKVVQLVIDQLRDTAATGIWDEITPRHLWDEYCWQLQYVSADPISQEFDRTVQALIRSEIEALSMHSQVFLTAYACRCAANVAGAEVGVVDVEAIITLILKDIDGKAARRGDLNLIGNDCVNRLQCDTSPGGIVCSALSDANLLWEILGMHAHALILGASEDDILKIGKELLDAYLGLVSSEVADCYLASQFFDDLQKNVSAMLLEQDIIPALENLQGEIEELLES